LFPDNFPHETQIIATVMSTDHDNEPAVAAMLGASAALAVSDIPFTTCLAGVRIGRINEEFVINPTPAQLAESQMNMFVVGSEDAIFMVEGSAKEISENVALEAILLAHREIQPVLAMQKELQRQAGKPKKALAPPPERDMALVNRVTDHSRAALTAALK